METLQSKVRTLAGEFSRQGKRCDEAWLKMADLRTVQGGATCEEAQELYTVARKLNTIANDLDYQG